MVFSKIKRRRTARPPRRARLALPMPIPSYHAYAGFGRLVDLRVHPAHMSRPSSSARRPLLYPPLSPRADPAAARRPTPRPPRLGAQGAVGLLKAYLFPLRHGPAETLVDDPVRYHAYFQTIMAPPAACPPSPSRHPRCHRGGRPGKIGICGGLTLIGGAGAGDRSVPARASVRVKDWRLGG